MSFFFFNNIICVNCDVCECVCVQYKYNITLYNLINEIQSVCYFSIYCYRVIITFCNKVSDLPKQIIKLVIVQVFNWLSRHLIYYLCLDEYGCMDQFNTMLVD